MTVKVGNTEVELDPEILKFDETTINDFLSKYASLYDDFMQHHTNAAYIHSKLEDRYEALLAKKIVEYKMLGGSDMMAKSRGSSDEEVQESLEKVRIAEHVKDRIWGYIRSMDKAHTNALQLCYNLRKELDKIFPQHIKKVNIVNE
jgi:hypothetical protein